VLFTIVTTLQTLLIEHTLRRHRRLQLIQLDFRTNQACAAIYSTLKQKGSAQRRSASVHSVAHLFEKVPVGGMGLNQYIVLGSLGRAGYVV
jgi:hypothetical protein